VGVDFFLLWRTDLSFSSIFSIVSMGLRAEGDKWMWELCEMPIYCLFSRGTVLIVRVDDLTALAHSCPLKPSGRSKPKSGECA